MDFKTSEMIYTRNRNKNAEYELRCLMDSYLRSKNEAEREALLIAINLRIPK